jgi:hypothetical protein
MELNFEQRITGIAAMSAGLLPQDRKHDPALDHVCGKVWSTVTYPEGGSCTM